MYYLPKILVRINANADREAKIRSARYIAESETEDFYEKVWDWRETDTAGRWADKYPINVILAEDNVDAFVKQLNHCKSLQMETMKDDLKTIQNGEFFQLFKEGKLEDIYNRPTISSLGPDLWRLHRIIKILSGKYNPNSYFYSADDRNSRITDELMNAIRKNPKEYALVVFDQPF